MPVNYNFISGSTIDTSINILFDMLKSEKCYLGFARGEKSVLETFNADIQWGVNTLINVEYRNDAVVGDVVAKAGDTLLANKFFDVNSLKNTSTSGAVNRVDIYKVANGVYSLSGLTPEYSSLTLNFAGQNWMMIQGLPQDYYTKLLYSTTDSYYIVSSSASSGFDFAAKIMNKTFTNVPYFSTECTLYNKTTSKTVLSNIQKISNVLGEHYVVGLNDPSSIGDTDVDVSFQSPSVSAIQFKTEFKDSTYALKDSNGLIVIDNISFVSPDASNDNIYFEVISPEGDLGNTNKYVCFQYEYQGYGTQYIKFIIGDKQVTELAIWNEHLPYDSLIPTSDANPPGLQVSFLKNPLLVKSLFDVKGVEKILKTEVEFVKELNSIAEKNLYTNAVSAGGYGFELETIEMNGSGIEHQASVKTAFGIGDLTIALQNYHNLVIGDTFWLPTPLTQYTVTDVSYEPDNSFITLDKNSGNTIDANFIIVTEPSSAVAKIYLAKTSNKEKALQYGFNSLIVNKGVDLVGAASPTEDTYRQLFICFAPEDSTGTVMTADRYKATDYNTDQIFNKATQAYELGTLIYLANKVPVYRKYIFSSNGKEDFKIIL